MSEAAPKPRSGVRTVLQYTGIPPSWLDKRPRLPSRNWLIFLSITGSLTAMYAYDQRECKRIRLEYTEKVRPYAEQPITDSLAPPRRIKVYGAKWPGDEDFDMSMRYFRKYVKPILAAAAVDYDLIRGKRHGDIAAQVAEEIRLRRRRDAGIDEPSPHDMALPTYLPPAEADKLDREGGIVIVGRPTWKEFMAGLKAGWTNSLDKVDQDALLSQEFENDGHFDETDDEHPPATPTVHPLSAALGSGVFTSLQRPPTSSDKPETQSSLSSVPPPHTIPPLAPILFVPFTNFVGFRQIPHMIWGFFNQREKVRDGAEAAYSLIKGHTRAFMPPFGGPEPLFSDLSEQPKPPQESPENNVPSKPQGGDLDFGKSSEKYYLTWLSTTVSEIQRAREKFYASLREKLDTARALDRRTRDPTKDEMKYPPPTEFDLREDRMKKEKRWRNDLEGIEIVRPERGVAWDARFRDSLRVFVEPPEDVHPFN